MAEDLLERVRREIHERKQTASDRDRDGASPRRPGQPRRPRATPGANRSS